MGDGETDKLPVPLRVALYQPGLLLLGEGKGLLWAQKGSGGTCPVFAVSTSPGESLALELQAYAWGCQR